ncbi:MAG: Phosphoglucomutase @ Phosphomannomutase [uncultured Sphingosinicella sp.]|uniref:Phosphoglucomutase @ Phosphomannomutase n=1 Tax=uncultured Sphingosinicella sp. TaxID=478748 RepID=A0A6J4TYD3_9SPHN|nr:phosphomannomutase/phosphoglucomutase [uncultured Sphingosinicella sp.]CAA9535755.1 MAG: Phosphoglucomutase @ Phosphomannomutase [uncultured Sphingosinicella sp.]
MASSSLPLNPALRKSYDLRGTVGRGLGAGDARSLGLRFASLARARGLQRIATSRDGRVSSPELEGALVEGLLDGGIDVTRMPLGPTPLVSFAINRLRLDGGIMVTGSHNPADQNGFKLLLGGHPVYGEMLGALWEAEPAMAPGGSVREVELTGDYIDALLAEVEGLPPTPVAFDSGNGATGEVVEQLARRLPVATVTLHTRIDGSFPNHHPDPSVPENLEELSEAVRRNGCSFGFAFDGDGDRVGLVDETGAIVWADQLLLLLARDVLAERPGSAIVADVKSSRTLFDGIAAAGGRAVMGPSGYVLVRERMLREGAPLAGEMSGHIFFGDRWHHADDGLYVAMRAMRAISRSGRTLRQFRESLPPTFATPELRLPCPDDRKAEVLSAVGARVEASGAAIDRTDGLRVTETDGWWLLRASGTEPKLTARCEAGSPEALARLEERLQEHLRAAGLS